MASFRWLGTRCNVQFCLQLLYFHSMLLMTITSWLTASVSYKSLQQMFHFKPSLMAPFHQYCSSTQHQSIFIDTKNTSLQHPQASHSAFSRLPGSCPTAQHHSSSTTVTYTAGYDIQRATLGSSTLLSRVHSHTHSEPHSSKVACGLSYNMQDHTGTRGPSVLRKLVHLQGASPY